MTIAVLLQTCHREDLTRRTVESFCAHNDTSGMVLLHADDEAVRRDNIAIAEEHGFSTVFAPLDRRGQMAGLKAMCAALPSGVRWVAYLESDWETVREWPWDWCQGAVEAVRLFGERKAMHGPRAMAGTRCLATNRPILWTPLMGGADAGQAHFSPPSIVRASVLLPMVRQYHRVKDIMLARPLDSLRPVDNFVWHLGDEQTPEFMA